MTVLQAILLGIVQGATELLPISSSAHLFLISYFLNWHIPESFDVALHAGTLLAIVIFFYKDWLILINGAYRQIIKGEKSFESKMFWYIILSTIPSGIIGFVLDKFLGDFLTKPVLIAIMLIIMGVLLYIVDKNAKNKTNYNEMSKKQTFLIGLSQALAFIPGVSRSGITMTTGRALGVSREATAKFSFMLSIPIVFVATLYKFKNFVFNIPFVVGVLVSFIVSVLVIKFLLDYLQKGNFKIFAIYRVIIGIIVLIMLGG